MIFDLIDSSSHIFDWFGAIFDHFPTFFLLKLDLFTKMKHYAVEDAVWQTPNLLQESKTKGEQLKI